MDNLLLAALALGVAVTVAALWAGRLYTLRYDEAVLHPSGEVDFYIEGLLYVAPPLLADETLRVTETDERSELDRRLVEAPAFRMARIMPDSLGGRLLAPGLVDRQTVLSGGVLARNRR